MDVGGELGRYGSQSPTQSTDNLLEIDADQRRFAMELCSIGENPCGAIEWATNDSAMVPLINCKADTSSWLKAKYPGSGASWIRGRPGEMTSGSFGKSLKLHLFSRVARITFSAAPEHNIEGTKQTRMKKKIDIYF